MSDHVTPAALRQYLDGGLPPGEAERVEAHLEVCGDCRARLRELAEGTTGEATAPYDPARVSIDDVDQALRPPIIPGFDYALDDAGWPVLLGSGGFGQVYLGRRAGTGEPVAVKILAPDAGDSLPARVAFATESAALLNLLDHPNIVRGLDVGAAGGRMYYVMEYVPSRNLALYLGRGDEAAPIRPAGGGPGGPDWARHVARRARELALAVHHAHRLQVTHRDLKPQNVLAVLPPGGGPGAGPGDNPLPRLVIIDFGLARVVLRDAAATAPESGSDNLAGTPAYMAPELFLAKVPDFYLVDVYGLGTILYQMLTGHWPYLRERNLAALRESIRRDPLPPPSRLNPAVPRALDAVCRKLLAKDPADRYRSALEAADDLDLFVRGRRPWAAWPGFALACHRWRRQHPVVAALLALLACLLVATAWLGWRERLSRREAETQTGIAREQKRAAEANELRARELAFQNLKDTAFVALGRGQYGLALKLFDQVVAKAAPQTRTFYEVERLQCLLAHGHWDRLEAELTRLEADPSLDHRQRARVRLVRADVLLWELDPGRQEAGLQLLREALAPGDGLAPADAHYARGLLADGSVEAVGHFDAALEADRFHLRARTAVLMESVLTGRFDEARRHADFVAAAFPGEPVAPLAMAVVATLEQDAEARRGHLADLEALVEDEGRRQVIGEVFRGLDDVIRANREMHAPRTGVLDALVGANARWLSALMPVLQQAERQAELFRRGGLPRWIGVGLPVLRRPQRVVATLAEAQRLLERGRGEEAVALLAPLREQSPESFVRYLLAAAHFRAATDHYIRGDVPAFLRESREAREAAEEAARAPTVMPFAPYRHNALWLCVWVEQAWRVGRPDHARRLACFAAGCVQAPGAPAALGLAAPLAVNVEALRLFPEVTGRGHLLTVLSDSCGYDEARSDLVPLLLGNMDPADARLVLDDWAADEPQEVTPARLRALFEYDHRDFAGAVFWADRVLALRAWDLEIFALREKARRHLAGR